LFFFSSFEATSQSIPDSTGSKVKKAQAMEALKFHNKVRKDVGVPPLQWSAEAASFAQAWADQLASNGCKMQHRPYAGTWAQKFGENIYFSSRNAATPLMASTAWYNEIKDFTYGKLEKNGWAKSGHYTQMVWRTTTKVGIGAASCPSGAVIIVANYDPAGNFMGEKPY
jgi:uncharacterized protein YkwD